MNKYSSINSVSQQDLVCELMIIKYNIAVIIILIYAYMYVLGI